jgi:hypothetical protein
MISLTATDKHGQGLSSIDAELSVKTHLDGACVPSSLAGESQDGGEP